MLAWTESFEYDHRDYIMSMEEAQWWDLRHGHLHCLHSIQEGRDASDRERFMRPPLMENYGNHSRHHTDLDSMMDEDREVERSMMTRNWRRLLWHVRAATTDDDPIDVDDN